LVSLSGCLFLLLSKAGFQVVLQTVPGISSGAVSVEKGSGRILGNWKFDGFKMKMPGVEVSVKELSLEWHPAELLQGNLHLARISLDTLAVTLQKDKSDSEKKDVQKIVLPEITLPFGIVLKELSVNNGTIRYDGDSTPLLVIERLNLQLSGGADKLRIDQLSLKCPQYGTRLSGEIQLSGDWPFSTKGTWWTTFEGYSRFEGVVEGSGPLENPELLLSMLQPRRVTVRAQLGDIFQNSNWQIQASAEDFDPHVFSSGWPEMVLDVGLTSSGTVDSYQAQSIVKMGLKDMDTVTANLLVTGDEAGISIKNVTLESGASRAELSGTVAWQDALVWDIDAKISDLELSAYTELPLSLVEVSAKTHGGINEKGLYYSIENGDLKGRVDDFNLDIHGGVTLLTGSDSGLDLQKALIEIAGSTLDLSGSIRWKELFSWDAVLVFNSLNPAVVKTLPQGDIKGSLSSKGSIHGGDVSADVTIRQISGVLEGFELTGGGAISLENNTLSFDNVHLENGDNNLRVQGIVGDEFDLSFTVNGADLERIQSALRGNIELSGRLSGSREQPRLVFTGSSDGVTFEDYSIGGLKTDFYADFGDEGVVEIDVAGTDVQLAGFDISSIEAKGAGSLDQHVLKVQAESEIAHIAFEVQGALDSIQQWSGTVLNTTLIGSGYERWQQQGSALVSLSKEHADVSGLCFSSASSDLCIAGSWNADGAWSADLKDLRFDLSALKRWKLIDRKIEGEVHGRIAAAGDGTTITRLDGRAGVPELAAALGLDGMYEHFRWFDSEISFHLENKLLKSTLYSRFVDNSSLNMGLDIGDFGDLSKSFETMTLSGYIRADVKDLSPLAVLTSDYLNPTGSLSTDLDIGGTIGSPLLQGNTAVEDGAIVIPSLGITSENISASLQFRDKLITVSLDASSGQGKASGTGTLRFDTESWAGEFSITGKDVLLINHRELKIIADPDLLLTLSGEGGSLKGRLVIPEAFFKTDEMTGSDSESGDVIIMDERGKSSSWPFLLDIAVEVGEDVHVEGYGLKGDLKGAFSIANGKNGSLRGLGELYFENSTFSIYDREIEIVRGRVIFDGGPVDSPGIDVSARKVFKADRLGYEDIIVGVDVSGIIDNYDVRLFSQPVMTDEDIIAYLVIGRPLSASTEGDKGAILAAAQLVGMKGGNNILGNLKERLPLDTLRLEGSDADSTSLVVGKYLAEDLFISYDFNLFKNTGFFKVRYDFGKGFSVESRNSSVSNGLSLLYSFEK